MCSHVEVHALMAKDSTSLSSCVWGSCLQGSVDAIIRDVIRLLCHGSLALTLENISIVFFPLLYYVKRSAFSEYLVTCRHVHTEG